MASDTTLAILTAILGGAGEGINQINARQLAKRKIELEEASKRRLATEYDTRQYALAMARDRDIANRSAMANVLSTLPYTKGVTPELGARAAALLAPTAGQGLGAVDEALRSLSRPVSPYAPGLVSGVQGPGYSDASALQAQQAAEDTTRRNQELTKFLTQPVEKGKKDKPADDLKILSLAYRRSQDVMNQGVAGVEKFIGSTQKAGESLNDYFVRVRPSVLTKAYTQVYVSGTKGQFPSIQDVQERLLTDYDPETYQKEAQSRRPWNSLNIPALLSTSPFSGARSTTPFAESTGIKGMTIR